MYILTDVPVDTPFDTSVVTWLTPLTDSQPILDRPSNQCHNWYSVDIATDMIYILRYSRQFIDTSQTLCRVYLFKHQSIYCDNTSTDWFIGRPRPLKRVYWFLIDADESVDTQPTLSADCWPSVNGDFDRVLINCRASVNKFQLGCLLCVDQDQQQVMGCCAFLYMLNWIQGHTSQLHWNKSLSYWFGLQELYCINFIIT